MKNILIVSKKPDLLTHSEREEIIKLHQQVFELSAENIIFFLKERSYVDLFYDKKNKELIGTIGIQWYLFEEIVILYVGNAVINKNKRQNGLLTISVIRAILKTILKFPLKRKYILGFATSPKAYAYFTKYKYSWPKPFQNIPKDIYDIMGKFLTTYYPGRFKIQEHGYIMIPDQACIRTKNKNQKIHRFQESWFASANLAYEQGYQLPCIAALNCRNYLTLINSACKLPKKRSINDTLNQLKNNIIRFRDVIYWIIIVALIYLLLIS